MFLKLERTQLLRLMTTAFKKKWRDEKVCLRE